LAACFAHAQALTTGQDDGAFASAFASNLVDVVHIGNDRSVDADKLAGREREGELLDALAQHEALRADVQASVVVGGLDPLNLVDVDDSVLLAVGNQQAFRILRSAGIGQRSVPSTACRGTGK
jgi:hypothetical protein